MKPSALLCFLAAVAAVLAADAAGTNTVEKFAYRGTLANADGSAFASALPMQMTFRLYDRETGGKPLWGRTRPVRVEADGSFYIELSDDRGSPSDANLPYAELAQALASGSGTFWIGLSPGDYSEMAPRQRLASVPCALHAVTADRFTDLRAGTLQAKAVHADSATIGNLTVTDTFHAPGDTLDLGFTEGGTFAATKLVQLNGAIDGIQTDSGEYGDSFKTDSLVLSRGATNLKGGAWGCSFVTASDSPTSAGFDSPAETRVISFGKRN